MQFSRLMKLASPLLLAGFIPLVAARPGPTRAVEVTSDGLLQQPTTTTSHQGGSIKRDAPEEDSLPEYTWIADLEAIKNGDTQIREYDMGPEEFAVFLAVSGYKPEDAVVEEEADDGEDDDEDNDDEREEEEEEEEEEEGTFPTYPNPNPSLHKQSNRS